MLYTFRAKNLKGKEITGKKEAKNPAILARILKDEGYVLVDSAPSQKSAKSQLQFSFNSLLKRVSLQEKMLFARHLSVMIGAGLSLNRALEVLGNQTENVYFKKIIAKLNGRIYKGESFADALKMYPKIFGDLFINMVKVGEVSGNLEGILKTLAYQMEKDYELRSKVKGAFIYPAVIIVAMVLIGVIMMIFVVPKLTSIFEELKIDLPITTQFVILVSNFLANHTIIFIISLIIFGYLALKAVKTRAVKEKLDLIFLNMPIFSNIVIKINTARMARALSSLLTSGVAITQSLEIVSRALTNKYFSTSLIVGARDVKKGKNLSEILVGYEKIYPPLVIQMIAVGEETGTVDEILAKLADFYEEEVYTITKNLATIIEPILMIFIGAAVGFFAVSMLQPMYSIVESI